MLISRVSARLLICAGILAGTAAHAQDTVRLAGTYTVSSALPYYVARDKGYFAAENLNVVPVNVQNSALAVQTIIAGEADGAANMVSLEAANINARRPGTITYFAMFGQNSKYHMEQFIARPDFSGSSLKDLKGANIFVAAGPANAAAARAALKAVGLEEGRDYRLSEIPLPQHVGAIAAKTFDAGYTLEPFASIAVKQGVAKRIEIGVISTHILKQPDMLAYAAGTGLTADFIKAKPDVARRFANAWAKALADIEKDGPDIRQLLVKHMNTPADIAPEMVILKAQMVKQMTPQDMAAFQAFVDFGVQNKVVPAPVKVTDFTAALGD